MTTTASVSTLIDVYVAPTSVFDKIQQAKKWSWLAFLILVCVSSATLFVFFDGMSPEWIVEQQLLQAGEMTVSEREAAEAIMSQTADKTSLIAAVMAPIASLVIFALFAGYFLLVGKTAKNNHTMSYGDWFAFSVWSNMPTLINSLGLLILVLTSANTDLPLSLPNYASINQLVLGYEIGDALYSWAEALNLFYVWTTVIAAIGLQRVCDMSVTKSFIFAALPYVAVFGLWFVFA